MKKVVTFGEIMLRLSPPGFERLLQSPRLAATFGCDPEEIAITRNASEALQIAHCHRDDVLRVRGIDSDHRFAGASCGVAHQQILFGHWLLRVGSVSRNCCDDASCKDDPHESGLLEFVL